MIAMYILLLIIIYIAFISLGLPDALFGVSWPLIYKEFQVPYDTAGYVSVLSTSCTVFSALMSGRLNRRFGTKNIVIISGAMTALALLGLSTSHSIFFIILMAIPLGLGAGSVDTSLNNYVAMHYKAHHMNWLHSFWGIGATTGPIIMAAYIGRNSSWQSGYFMVGLIQCSITLLLLLSYPIWNKVEKLSERESDAKEERVKTFVGISIIKT